MKYVLFMVALAVFAGCQHRCTFTDGSESSAACVGLLVESGCRPEVKK